MKTAFNGHRQPSVFLSFPMKAATPVSRQFLYFPAINKEKAHLYVLTQDE
ncbi:hypothetical protein [Chitinophaga skermanii]|nr:hypothetical protein [Chitinophaga skermanii]